MIRRATPILLCLLMAPAVAGESTQVGEGESACGDLGNLSVSGIEEHVWKPLERFRRIEPICGGVRRYLSARSQLESFVGNHRAALAYMDKREALNESDGGSREEEDLLPEGTRSIAAESYIAETAEKHQIVIVNERHHASPDRLLPLSLLAPLAKIGYNYLAIEGIWWGDEINKRGYPVGDTGYYARDVVFAELIRTALSLGYEMVAYEEEPGQRNNREGRSAHNNREYWHARNIATRTLEKDPEARVLVFCGWGHVWEEPWSDWVPMAHVLKNLTGIDPLTVNQTSLSERSESKFEHAWRIEAERKGLLDAVPVVLVGPQGEPLNRGTGVDLDVLTPRTRYLHGRPSWMEMFGRRRAVEVPIPECENTACVVEVRDPSHPEETAYDRVESRGGPSVVLYLPRDVKVELHIYGLDGSPHARRRIEL